MCVYLLVYSILPEKVILEMGLVLRLRRYMGRPKNSAKASEHVEVDLIEMIADRVVEKFRKVNRDNGSYVYIGTDAICRAMGMVPSTDLVRKLYNKGLVMDKTGVGKWRTTPGLIDKYIYERKVLMDWMAKNSGVKVVHGSGAGGYAPMPTLEKYTSEQRAAGVREIVKDGVRKVVGDGH
jgi:hypothetical protein